MYWDNHNIEQFNSKYSQGEYVCCVCDRKTDLDSSYSNRGKKLICHRCFIKLQHLFDVDKKFILDSIDKEEDDQQRKTV